MVADLPKLPGYAAPDPEGDERTWSGYLTVENVEHVAERFRRMFEGKRFTAVHCYEYRGWEPEVQTGLRLDPTHRSNGRLVDTWTREYEWGTTATFGFSTSRISYGFHTQAQRQLTWFWLHEPDAGFANRFGRDADGVKHGRPQDVLQYISDAMVAEWAAQVDFDGMSCRIKERMPNGKWAWFEFRIEPTTRTQELLDELGGLLDRKADIVSLESMRELIENARWEMGYAG